MKLAKVFIVFTFLLAFAASVSAQDTQFPNELKGFEFYKRGKLRDVELKISTREQIKIIFGDECEFGGCAYNGDWEVGFIYYLKGWTRSKILNKVEETYVVSPEYEDKIFAIILRPKKAISFNQSLFSKKFQTEFSLGEHSIKLKNYSDSNGLYYTLLDDEDCLCKGNLRSIQYYVPLNLEQDVFILTQIQDKPLSSL